MKLLLCSLAAGLTLLCSCHLNDNPSQRINSPANLLSSGFTINTLRDTILKTPEGALIDLTRGSIDAGSDSIVELEMKEAYSISAMIKAGLTTTTNGQPLSSGGMFYVGVKGQQTVKITRPIRISVPSPFLEPGMQLYKGKEGPSGKIDWENPGPLASSRFSDQLDSGRVLFQAHCASCHGIGQDGTAPNLAHLVKQFPAGSEFYQKFCSQYVHGLLEGVPYTPAAKESIESNQDSTNNAAPDTSISVDAVSETEVLSPHPCSKYSLYHRNLVDRFGSWPTPYALTRAEFQAIYRYIQNESDRRALPIPNRQQLLDCIDSCIAYQEAVLSIQRTEDSLHQVRKKLVKENGSLTREERAQTPGANNGGQNNPPSVQPSAPPPAAEKIVQQENNNAVFYQFTIESFGWYNIDVLTKEVNGNKESSLMVRMIGSYREQLDVFLILPDQKIYVRGGPTTNEPGSYAFFETNGRIFLPQQSRAYILAMKETDARIAWDLREFTTSLNQTIEMNLRESTMEAFNQAVATIRADQLQIRVGASENGAQIHAVDQQLKGLEEKKKYAISLKPASCQCCLGENSYYRELSK